MRPSRSRHRRPIILGALWAFWVLGAVAATPGVARADCSHPDRPGFAPVDFLFRSLASHA